jgi:Rieske Fe-S protein
MSESDKYPESSGRRRFVKGVVGSASLSAVGTVGAAGIDLTTQRSGEGGGPTQFYGVENTDGPAPRAMPQVPIRIDDEGYLEGLYPEVQEVERQGETVEVPQTDIGGVTYSADWFQYCGIQGYEGLQPDYDGDNYLRYVEEPGYDWQSNEVSGGDRVNVDDFEDYETWGNDIGDDGVGKPASCVWRSEDTENTIPVQVLRSTQVSEIEGVGSGWVEESTEQDFIGWLNKCTHFCCVPGFKSTGQAEQFGGANKVYCPCHQSIYDPFSIVRRSFVAYPRPED